MYMIPMTIRGLDLLIFVSYLNSSNIRLFVLYRIVCLQYPLT